VLSEGTTLAVLDRENARDYLSQCVRAVENKRWAELGIALDRLYAVDNVCTRVVEAARAGSMR
jgi:hypothetical protein